MKPALSAPGSWALQQHGKPSAFCTLRKSQTRDLLRSREAAEQGETMKHLQAGHRSASAGMDWPLSASRPGLFASAITSCQVRELPQTKSTAEVQG